MTINLERIKRRWQPTGLYPAGTEEADLRDVRELIGEVEGLRELVEQVKDWVGGKCETFTEPYDCIRVTSGRKLDADYGADEYCPPCRVRFLLGGLQPVQPPPIEDDPSWPPPPSGEPPF